MEYEKIKPFIGKEVCVVTISNTCKGVLTNTVSEFDTSSGEEEIDVHITKGKSSYYEAIPFSEIEKIELI